MAAGVVCDTCTRWLQCCIACRQSFIFVRIVLISTPTELSWPRCSVWTSTLIKQTSLSNTRHQSSPEKTPHQVKDTNRGHLWFTVTTAGQNSNMFFFFFVSSASGPKISCTTWSPCSVVWNSSPGLQIVRNLFVFSKFCKACWLCLFAFRTCVTLTLLWITVLKAIF